MVLVLVEFNSDFDPLSEFRCRWCRYVFLIPLNSGVLTWWYLTTLGLVLIIDDFVSF